MEMSDSDSEPLMSLDDVEVHFKTESSILSRLSEDDEYVYAVDGVSLDIQENDIIALVGESGCGKTTLGKTIIGLQKPTSGTVKYRGQDIWEAKASKGSVDIPYSKIRRSLQIIHQDPGSSLNPNRKVINILSEPLRKWQDHLSKEDRRARILGMLEYVGMEPATDYAHRYPHQLSGGEKQRVALVRALLMNPDLILADEAISALDVSLRIEMMDLMHDLQDRFNTSFVFISHDLSNARYFTDRVGGKIGVMYLGELVEMGDVDEILHDPRHPYTKALRWATPDLNPYSDDDQGAPIEEIDTPDPVNPPSGCKFHTRCPKAREVCRNTKPDQLPVDGDSDRFASCFREEEDHEYWSSEKLVRENERTNTH